MRTPSIPDWLKSLKPGAYQMNDLKQISNSDQSNVKYYMLKYGALTEKQHNKKGHMIVIYYWEGFQNV